MVLLIGRGKLEEKKTAAAVRATFLLCATHGVPQKLDPPRSEWTPVFEALAKECGLGMKMEEGFATVRDFIGKLKI